MERRTRLELIGLVILVTGLGMAVIVDRTAGDKPGQLLGYDMNGESPQPVRPEDSKQYLRNLEQYNGKTGVLLYELRTWFVGLWQGKALARTLYCLTAVVALAFFYEARRPPPDSK
jgi:hypothetical protein